MQNRQEWIESIIDMLELRALEMFEIGDINSGGLSFEQRKRVSIAVELAANPSILFLDEPTTGNLHIADKLDVFNVTKFINFFVY